MSLTTRTNKTTQQTEHLWKTWGHRHESTPSRIFSPRSINELQEFVREHAVQAHGGEQNQHTGKTPRIKVVGASKSTSAIAQPSELMVSLHYLTGASSVSVSERRATFLAGTTVREANNILAQYGLAFENLGRLDQQTLAGAVSTGTHGSGFGFGGFSTQVRELSLVTASGELLTCSSTQNPQIFRAALVGLGALGILVSLTFDVVPMFRIHAEERGRAFNAIVPSFHERAKGADHYEFSWFPGANEVRTRRLTRLPLLTDGYMNPQAKVSQARRHGGDYLLNNGVFEAMSLVGTTIPATQGALNKVSNWGKGNRRYADFAPRVFTQNRTVRQNSMEYAFDIEQFEAVIYDLQEHLTVQKTDSSFPLSVSVAAADNIPLSPAYGRETVYISARTYWRADCEEYFAGLEKIFNAHQGRPHWGQWHSLNAAQLRALYPEFDSFVSLRTQMDPNGMFLNPYLQKVLLD